MGLVFEAMDPQLNRRVALKALAEGNGDEEMVERLQREARATARLRHPNIVAIHEVGEVECVPYLTMDFVEGRTLADRLAATADLVRRGEIDPGVFLKNLEILRDVARAIAVVHALGIVHRDIKPGNVLLDGKDTPYVTDFGLAKDFRRDERGETAPPITLSGTILGTPGYMSPEQARGDTRNVSSRGDVFSLGVILYEMICGAPPFQGDSLYTILDAIAKSDPVPPRELRPELPRDLETICLRCLEKDPARRYADAGDLASDLARFLDAQPIAARRIGVLDRLRKRIDRNRPMAVAIALIGIFAGGLAIGYPLHFRSRRLEGEKLLRAAAAADQAGKFDEALSQIERARDLLGDRPDLLSLNNAVRRHAGEATDSGDGGEHEADRFLDEAMQDLLLAFTSFAQGSQDVAVRNANRALEALRRAERIAPEYHRTLHVRGLCHYRLWQVQDPRGGLAEATEAFEGALDRRPGHAPGLQALLEARLAEVREAWSLLPGTWEQGADGVVVMWEGWGESSTALEGLAEVCRARLDEIAPEEQDARDRVRLRWVEGALLACEGSVDAALAELSCVDDPPDLAASARLIEGECLLYIEGKSGDAVARIEEGRRFGGDAPLLLVALGRARAQEGDWEGAVGAWEALVEARPDVPEWRAHLGLALMEAGREAEGKTALEQSLQEGLPEGPFRTFVEGRVQ